MVLINEALLLQVAESFDYNELLGSADDLINFDYWSTIADQYDILDIGLLMSQGVNADTDFDGSGTYKVI